jgi:hypothetical protein
MKTLVAAFALASLIATSAWAKIESPVRPSMLTTFKAERVAMVARQPAQHYALILGVGF